jgi:tRNA(His) guanylyltransferase
MRIDDLDGRMRAFEAALDPCVPPSVWMVARLDGRNFTRLSKETHPFEAPFDRQFHDYITPASKEVTYEPDAPASE